MGKGGGAPSRSASPRPPDEWTLEFYDEPGTGRVPVREWMKDLDGYKRRAIGSALHYVLQRLGPDVVQSEWGKNLGEGLFEFRNRHDADEIIRRFTDREPDDDPNRGKVQQRVFFHPHGAKLILLLGGYDKGEDPSDKRQQAEIELARKRLREYRLRA